MSRKFKPRIYPAWKNTKKIIPVKPNMVIRKKKPLVRTFEFPLYKSSHDLISYTIAYTKERGKLRVVEITCVAYNTRIRGSWKTIVRYDNFHGKMHKHLLVTMEDITGDITEQNVKQTGNQNSLLAWAIKELTKNYIKYKSDFFKRNKLSLTEDSE